MSEDQFISNDKLEHSTIVFLSYAREDTDFIKDLQIRLNVRGIHSWRDADDLISGSPFKDEIAHAIEHEAYAIALYITPAFLKSSFIWTVEIPAALRRHKLDRHFHIIPIMQDLSFSDVRQACMNWKVADLSQFNAIVLTDKVIETAWKERNDVARRILRSAMTLRLRRAKADLSYEPSISLKTFPFNPHTTYLDLDLDWLELMHEKERLSTLQEWERIFLPGLLDVKQIISEKISNRRIHIFIQAILPAAVAFGFAFRKTSRFVLLLERSPVGDIWSTEAQLSEKEPLHMDFHYNDQGNTQIALVEVATSRSTEQSVQEVLPHLGFIPGYHVQLKLSELSNESVKDAAHALVIAQQVGSVCQSLYDQQRVGQIHLFVAVPVELAVLIGYYLNALCPIMLYEFNRGYKPFGIIQ